MTKRSKKAWTKWRKLVREQARSGQTVIAFCRERGLCRPYFFTWKKRLQESAAAKFLEVQVTERAAGTVGDGRDPVFRDGLCCFLSGLLIILTTP